MSFSMKPTLLFLVATFCFQCTPLSASNLVTNGSFEMPVIPVGGFGNFNTGSTAITGWTVVGPTSSIVSTAYTSFGLSFPAEDGLQWLDLTGYVSNTSEGVEQSVATTPGRTYNLSYYIGNQVDPGGPYGTTSTVNVFVNGSLIQTATNSGGGGSTTQSWQQFQTSFNATSASTVIEFLNGDSSTDNTNGLDNVTLNLGGSSVVPEPTTLSFLIATTAGFVGFLGFRRAAFKIRS